MVTIARARLVSSIERVVPSATARLLLTLGVAEDSVVASDVVSTVVSAASVTSFTLATA